MSETTELIKRLRESGLSQTEIAKRTGIPQPRLSRWENGEVPESADDALKIKALVEATLRGVAVAAAQPSTAKPLAKLIESPCAAAAEPRRERRLSERDEQTADPLLTAARRFGFARERG